MFYLLPGKGSTLQGERLFVLRFYGPVNRIGSCRARSVYLTTRLLGRLSPLSGKSVLCTFFHQKLTTALLNQRKGESNRRKYFMITLHERMLPTSAGVEPATSWSPAGRRIQLSHRGRQRNEFFPIRVKTETGSHKSSQSCKHGGKAFKCNKSHLRC